MAIFKVKQRLEDGNYKDLDLVADKLGDSAKTEVNTIVENNTTVKKHTTDIATLNTVVSAIDTSKFAPTNHATDKRTYGVATVANFGHTKISDDYKPKNGTSVSDIDFINSSAAFTAVSASSAAVQTAYCELYNGKNQIFYQDTQPSSGMRTGDLWIKPTTGSVTEEPNYVVGGNAVKCGYQINGHEVYQKIFTFTSLNTEKSIALGIDSYSMVWINTSDSFLRHANSKLTYPLPTIGYTTTFNDKINVYIEGNNLKLKSSSGWNDQWAFYVAVRYY